MLNLWVRRKDSFSKFFKIWLLKAKTNCQEKFSVHLGIIHMTIRRIKGYIYMCVYNYELSFTCNGKNINSKEIEGLGIYIIYVCILKL